MCIRDRAQVRASHAPKPGSRLLLADHLPVTVLGREREFFNLRFDSTENVSVLLEQFGQLPLPPYICLLYTSDAADERSSVDLGGRRIIKKNTHTHNTQHTQHTQGHAAHIEL